MRAQFGSETNIVLSRESMWVRSEGERLILGRANPDDHGWRDDTIDWDWFEPTMAAGVARFADPARVQHDIHL